MDVRIDIETGEALRASLNEVLATEPHLEYANFKPIAERAGAAAELHRERWLHATETIAVLVARDDNGRVIGALRLSEREFESDHFGRRMAAVCLPVCRPDAAVRLAAARSLYRAAWSLLGERGYQHAAARISTRDREALWSVQETGAVYVDTQVSWMCPLTGLPHDEGLSGRLRFECYEGEAVRALPPASWERLAAWGARAFDRGPLVFDVDLPFDRAKSVYQVWTEQVMNGVWADATLVVMDGDEVVAFISMLELPDVSRAAGIKVCGRGLGATLPEYRGMFTLIQREMIAAKPLGAAYMENETQVATIGSVNVYAKLGFRYLRSTCTFHRKLAGGEPTCG